MSANDLQYVVSMLQDANITAVARSAGMNYRTVLRIANGKSRAPRFDAICKLAEYFRNKSSVANKEQSK